MAEKTAPPSPGSGKGKPPKPGLTDIIDDNVLPVDPEKFTPEQKQDFEAMMQQARDQYLSSYMQTRKGSLVQKYKFKLVADIPGTGSSKDGDVKRDPDGSAQPSVKGATEGSAGIKVIIFQRCMELQIVFTKNYQEEISVKVFRNLLTTFKIGLITRCTML
jgi:hypothetical protein